MSESMVRQPRQVAVADHLWETFNLMAAEMGTDRESLINQALFAFARQNGYLQPGQHVRPPTVEVPPVSLSSPYVQPAPSIPPPMPAPLMAAPVFTAPPPVHAPAPPPPMPVYAAPPPMPAPLPPPPMPAYAAPAPRYEEQTPATGTPHVSAPPPLAMPTPAPLPAYEEPPNPQATMAIRAPRVSAPPPPPVVAAPPPPPPPMPAFVAPPPPLPVAAPPPPAPYSPPPQSAPDLGTKMSPDEVRAAQERVLQKADELERLVRGTGGGDDAVDDGLLGGGPALDDEPAASKKDGALVLYAEGREVDRVTNQRFLIGRGKHCDLIINSGKVSREHAAIVRDGTEFFIEDLGSSNGTWFDKKRITRRKIEDGDEYFVCSEKITCRFS